MRPRVSECFRLDQVGLRRGPQFNQHASTVSRFSPHPPPIPRVVTLPGTRSHFTSGPPGLITKLLTTSKLQRDCLKEEETSAWVPTTTPWTARPGGALSAVSLLARDRLFQRIAITTNHISYASASRPRNARTPVLSTVTSLYSASRYPHPFMST